MGLNRWDHFDDPFNLVFAGPRRVGYGGKAIKDVKFESQGRDTMVDFHNIYANQAENYERLVSREDYQGNLLPALAELKSLQGIHVLDLGAGTGRFTRLLASTADHILALDASEHMLGIAHDRLRRGPYLNWDLTVADIRKLPLSRSKIDMTVAGWSLGHSIEWYGSDWPREINRALMEIKRIMRPGGVIVIIETLGTGRETPEPPTPGLAAYYAYLVGAFGFSHRWIRTDYRFESVKEAEQLMGFFFGPELSGHIAQDQLLIVPECTGIWWLEV
jgi:ubiquinone/menaquinone biosynthesis C-methylase UbiE